MHFLTIEIYGSLFLSPHSHIPSKIGMSDFPRSVRLYSTFGGIAGKVNPAGKGGGQDAEEDRNKAGIG